MESTVTKIRDKLDSIINYLTPLLPLANCHMVEFITQNHWETFVPTSLRKSLETMDMNDAVEQFWKAASCGCSENTELSNWVQKAQSHYIPVNNEYCLSREQLQDRIKSLGTDIPPDIRITEFMSSKKCYEVQTMSQLVASIFKSSNATHCVEAGGGRGHLLVVCALAYHVHSLTVDCDQQAVDSAALRAKLIQKQWHAIAKKIQDGIEETVPKMNSNNLHRFARAFITEHTDLNAVVREQFPEHDSDDSRLLLTGLHTCGNLGPNSLRIFTSQPSVAAVFNVPCCYHLLTEEIDEGVFDVFQRDFGDAGSATGFPMSEFLRGYNLGRNARMLAAQSIHRVLQQRQLPARSLLYRALLQVIIKKYLPNAPLTEGKLKRLSKCETFDQYFKMADSILKLDIYHKMAGNLTDACQDIDKEWKKMVLFYLLRLCLAQVIESVILLDRLLYLYECGFEKAYLVKLFDPVMSPRCHSILALRRQ